MSRDIYRSRAAERGPILQPPQPHVGAALADARCQRAAPGPRARPRLRNAALSCGSAPLRSPAAGCASGCAAVDHSFA